MKRIFTVTLLITYCSVHILAQNTNSRFTLDDLFSKDGEQYFMFHLNGTDLLPDLATTISIDNVKGNTVYAYANRREFSRFLQSGLDYTILPHPGDYLVDPRMKDKVNIRDIEDWDFYPTYDAYVAMMNQFQTDYPDICSVFSIGTTVQGRELLMAKISDNVSLNENEPRFLYTSSMHGDEITAYVLMLRLINYLLSNYGSDDP